MIGGDADGSLRFWDAASGAKLWTLPVHKSAVIGVRLEGVDIVTRGLARGNLALEAAAIRGGHRSLSPSSPLRYH